MKRFVRSFYFSLSGLKNMITKERNFQIQIALFILVCIFGFYFKITSEEWQNILLISALVLGLETINSAIEKTCNLITTEIKPEIKLIKDIAAGAVTIASIFAVIIGVLVFWKYIF